MPGPIVKLVCAYTIYAGHRLARPDWSALENERVFGKCANNHGHQYRVEVTLSGPIHPETGMLINGYEVDRIVRERVVDVLDHKFLNEDVPYFRQNLPTAELIAKWCLEQLTGAFEKPVHVSRVRIYETPDLYVDCEPVEK